jgi:hypothetical protein
VAVVRIVNRSAGDVNCVSVRAGSVSDRTKLASSRGGKRHVDVVPDEGSALLLDSWTADS